MVIMIWKTIKQWVEKYDAWCLSLGLTPENKRSCVPYKKEEISNDNKTD
jgi:hypothetical protein